MRLPAVRCSPRRLSLVLVFAASAAVPVARAQEKETSTTATVRRRTTTTTVSGTVARESARRQALAADADSHLASGDAAYALRDYDTAAHEYKIVVDSLSYAPAAGTRRTAALQKFADASVKLAEQRIAEGRYADAENTLRVVLRPEYDPANPEVLRELKRLEDPEYYNQTVTPAFIDRVEQVKKLFVEAQGFYDTARFDLAFKRCEQILNLDPTNIAARKFQEKIDVARRRYDEHAYDEARGRAIEEVARGWARPVRRFGTDADSRAKFARIQRDDTGSTVAINAKLRRLVVPSIEFRQTTLRDAVEFLRQESRRLDPEQTGVNIFLKVPAGSASVAAAAAAAPAAPPPEAPPIPGIDNPTSVAPITATTTGPVATSESRISLSLNNIPLLEALRYVAQQASLKVRVEPFAVAIVPANEDTANLLQAEFRVPPGFIASSVAPTGPSALNAPAAPPGGAPPPPGGTKDVTGAGSGVIQRQDAKTFLEANGVSFPPGASAAYVPQGSRLVVRNTQENLDLVQALLESSAPDVIKQIEIESKFIEVTQTDLKELSFGVNVGSANIPGSKRLFVTGGSGLTPGRTPPTNGNDLDVGTRSGSFAIQGSAIDALLLGATGLGGGAAPGILNLAGVLTDPQFQIIVRALNQQKGVDLLSAPRVTTKSGQKAVIEIIREFIYPTAFAPPQIPTNFGNQGTSIVNAAGGSSTSGAFPVTPTTPTGFGKRNTGVTLDVEPVIGPDGFTIDLTLSPQVVDFDGFINYGSPINTVSTTLGISTQTRLTDNVINQPIFSTRKVTTSVSVYDGSTVILGGLTREDVQKVNDKVPVLGDVPLVGRLFRSKVDQNIKRNLIIFVTARLIDPAGQPINPTEEVEEEVQPLTEVPPAFQPSFKK